LLFIKCRIWIGNSRDVVSASSVIEGTTGGNRHVFAIPNIGVVKYGSNEPEEERKPSDNIGFGPPRCGKRRSNIRNLCPVKGDETHAHSMNITKHLVQRDIVRGDPAYPGEIAECLEQIPRQKVPNG